MTSDVCKNKGKAILSEIDHPPTAGFPFGRCLLVEKLVYQWCPYGLEGFSGS